MLQRQNCSIFKIIKRQISALYVTGDKAKENYAVLTPFFDFHEKFNNREFLEKNIKARNLQIDIDNVYEKWGLYKDVELKKRVMEKRRSDVAEELQKTIVTDENGIRKLKNEGRFLRDDLKNLKEMSYQLQDNFIHDFLDLPNELHERTTSDEHVLLSYLTKNTKIDSPYHLAADEFIDFFDETNYYLKGSAALFDLKLPFFCVNFLKDFTQFSNPDFVRSILPEAAGLDPKDFFQIKEEETENKINLLHLSGGGSLTSFLGFISKLSVYPTSLPFQFIANGKEYHPASGDLNMGLYSVSQSTVVQTFIATTTKKEADEKFDETVERFIEFYKKFNLHFQVVYSSADKLTPAESLRVNFEVYCPQHEKYFQIGHLSHFNNYLSKRLLFSFREGKEYKFPHIVAGTMINVPKILANLIDNEGTFKMPSFLN